MYIYIYIYTYIITCCKIIYTCHENHGETSVVRPCLRASGELCSFVQCCAPLRLQGVGLHDTLVVAPRPQEDAEQLGFDIHYIYICIYIIYIYIERDIYSDILFPNQCESLYIYNI